MTDEKKHPFDEAENIRRWSPGDRQSARDGGANAKASIEGSFWIALIAILLSFAALGSSWVSTNRSAVAAGLAADRAERAERSAALAREYAVTTFAETQSVLAEHGMSIEGPFGHHKPVPEAVYESYDRQLAAHLREKDE